MPFHLNRNTVVYAPNSNSIVVSEVYTRDAHNMLCRWMMEIIGKTDERKKFVCPKNRVRVHMVRNDEFHGAQRVRRTTHQY